MVAQFRPPIKQISETALPPQNVELEEAILGCILLDPNAYPRLLQLPKQLSPEAFYLSHHKTIFKAIQALANKGQPTDLMTVCSYLSDKKKLDEVGGASSLAQLLDRTVTAVNIDRYAERLIDKHIRRELIGVAQDITNLSFNTCNPLEYVCNTVKKLVEPLIDPILANKSTEEYEYSCVVSKVKEIMLYEHKPGLRYFKLDRLAKEVGSSVNKLENLFFMSMLEDQYEPLLSFKEMMVKYGKDTQKWVIQGLLPRGSLTELYALPGDGKTLLSYDLICSALIGEPWNGFPVANQKLKAVIIQTDEAPQATLLTLRDRLEGRNLEVYFKTCWTIEQLFQLKLELEEIQPDILMIDSLTSINRNTTKSENDSDYARNIYALRQMCGDMGMAGILIHHSNKLGDSRGSTGIPGAVDQVI
ncbi:MAG: DnaB-like helicase N-terminal domain-containing protein, partial [Jaaginema sp. PMC 1079.18]|nr:DnaB-like helicase N-terminal domain-containing protein [Jaaginema sp. PMC 1079.18]